jgi:hypothetical protein
MALKHCLDEGERVEADLGYRGENPETVKTAGPLYTDEKYVATKKNVASRPETANKRLKQYGCLTQSMQPALGQLPCSPSFQLSMVSLCFT